MPARLRRYCQRAGRKSGSPQQRYRRTERLAPSQERERRQTARTTAPQACSTSSSRKRDGGGSARSSNLFAGRYAQPPLPHFLCDIQAFANQLDISEAAVILFRLMQTLMIVSCMSEDRTKK